MPEPQKYFIVEDFVTSDGLAFKKDEHFEGHRIEATMKTYQGSKTGVSHYIHIPGVKEPLNVTALVKDQKVGLYNR